MIRDVVIAGAGIGGLTLAIALRRRGVRVTIRERSRELGPAGAGLGLMPNGIKALSQLGLGAATVAAGQIIGLSAFMTDDGRRLGRAMDVGTLFESPSVALHRGRLHQILLGAVEPAIIGAGDAIVSYQQRNEGVVAVCSGGDRVETELLVGADGLHSAIRAQLVGDGAPEYAGYTSWRGVTPAGSVPAPHLVTESWGRGERFGIVDIGFGEIYWFAVAGAPAGGRDRDVRRELLARFGGWHHPIPALIEATPADRILRTDICDRRPIDRWHDGRVVLLGDAAHPMTPNLGQGASQAIEDAIVLDRCLADEDTLEAALMRYERRRVTRANEIVRASRQFGVMAQWRNPLAVALRNTAWRLSALAPASMMSAQARKLVEVEL